MESGTLEQRQLAAQRLKNLASLHSELKSGLERELNKELQSIKTTCGFEADSDEVLGFQAIYDALTEGLFIQGRELQVQLNRYATRYLLRDIANRFPYSEKKY